MASGLRHDPYAEPQKFMDDIIGEMREVFDSRVAEVKKDVSDHLAASLSEIDAALSNVADAGMNERSIRMSCVHLAKDTGCSDSASIIRRADALAQYVLTGTGERPVSGTVNEIWDQAVMACWSIAHHEDETCCGEEGVMAGSIASKIEELFRGKKPGEA